LPNYHSPENETHYREVKAYIETEPEPDYAHAPDSAREAFQDMKYSVRIHWGMYSLLKLEHESWPFLQMPLEQRQAYQQLYQRFNPSGFDAGEWMDLFKRVGLEGFAITTKHHEGFSLFDTQTRVHKRINWTANPGGPQLEDCDLAYSVMDTPFKRDIIRELCDAARPRGLRIDFYFSHPDWYDADFRPYCFHPLQTPSVAQSPSDYGTTEYHHALSERPTWLFPERTPEETARMVQRYRTQLIELFTKYGPIDMLCLDMWLGKDIWPEVRETMKQLRRLQPQVMLRLRGIGNYGDYYTPEGFVPEDKSNTDMPWMVIYPLGRSFSYEPVARQHKGSRWIVHNLASSVAKGGSFMVGIGPDANGCFHPRAIKDLEGAGDWLKVNGEAIYHSHAANPWREGEDLLFTRSQDDRSLYAISTRWPGRTLQLNSVAAHEGLHVSLLGIPGELSWRPYGQGIRVAIPTRLQARKARPCKYAYVFKIES
jgi:alpha-L-fucosidase